MDKNVIEERAYAILRQGYGHDASFRSGQLEAIEAILMGHDSLIVEKTGWGKSLVYFIATRILREHGAGPTIIISPLLALMENQIDSAKRVRVNAVTINSDNREQWGRIYANLDTVDAIIISPERLSNHEFLEHLGDIEGIELVVVDEAHSISDWGHDFRPDYQRISKLIDGLPGNVRVLGTTATANNRVIEDVRVQMGTDIEVFRGDLIRENLAIQVNPSQTREQRFAWLAQMLTQDPILTKGQGIIYCLTHSDCKAVASYLSDFGVSVLPYYSGMGEDDNGNSIERLALESFIARKTRILAATVKLGMGYDKSDIRFVIHFQLPQNLIAYYQQIGRAGRDGLPAYAFLLHGQEDEEILRYFIQNAQASPNLLFELVQMAKRGVSIASAMEALNVKKAKLEEAFKYLLVHDYVYKDGSTYRASVGKTFDAQKEREKQDQLSESRIGEHNDLLEFIDSTDCYMKHIAAELDAPDAQETCGICTNCRGEFLVPVETDQQAQMLASQYLDSRYEMIRPRKRWSSGRAIMKDLQMQAGWALYADYYSAGGRKIKEGKYALGSFSSELVEVSASFLRERVIAEGIDCIVPIPSLRRPHLVLDFAKSLASALGIPCVEAIVKTGDVPEQKMLLNSAQQEKNIAESTEIAYVRVIRGKTVLIVDDMVDSRWTFTVAAAKLLEAGAERVYPFALVKTGGGD
ncbi:MAG: RecQ family ATP-dependent DNA helicase [Coriobacteriales bacterium]